MSKHIVAFRVRSLNKLVKTWISEHEQTHWSQHEQEVTALIRGTKSFWGVTALGFKPLAPVIKKQGRPKGLRAHKRAPRGSGRRKPGIFKQVVINNWLFEALQASGLQVAKVPCSVSLTASLLARMTPRAPEAWLSKCPHWGIAPYFFHIGVPAPEVQDAEAES